MDEKEIRTKRQSEVSKSGKEKELEVINLLKSDKKINEHLNIGSPSKVLNDLTPLYINYDNDKAQIDADICVVSKRNKKLVCVISVKKSFRERGAQTAYWALKIKQENKNYKYILATPDVDNELYNENYPERKRKWRIILPYECDSVFVYSYEGKKYKDNNFYVGKDYLIEYIRNLA